LSQSIVKAEGISPSSEPIALGVLQSQIVIFTSVTVANVSSDSSPSASVHSNLKHFYLLIFLFNYIYVVLRYALGQLALWTCHSAGCYNVSSLRAFPALGCFLMRSACTTISFFLLFDPIL
jgi:hypothetical protein